MKDSFGNTLFIDMKVLKDPAGNAMFSDWNDC